VEFTPSEVEGRSGRDDGKGTTCDSPAVRRGRSCCWRAQSAKSSRRAFGNQTGGRVFLFLHTDDFWRDYAAYRSKGVVFVRDPKEESYGTVAVFADLYGTLWDLLQPKMAAS
jgi:hypothetical protein